LELQHDSSSLKGNVYFAIKGKNPQNSLRLFFCLFFALVGKMDNTSFTCECGCILCPNVENFCPNNGQFFSIFSCIPMPYAYAFCHKIRLETRRWVASFSIQCVEVQAESTTKMYTPDRYTIRLSRILIW